MARLELKRIWVPWDPRLTSPNFLAFKHYGTTGRWKRASQAAALWTWETQGDRCFLCRVAVDVLVRRGRRMDDDGITGGLKWVRDALFSAIRRSTFSIVITACLPACLR